MPVGTMSKKLQWPGADGVSRRSGVEGDVWVPYCEVLKGQVGGTPLTSLESAEWNEGVTVMNGSGTE